MSVYTHHSNVRCSDCGEKHGRGALEDCIECLKVQVVALHTELAERLKEIGDSYKDGYSDGYADASEETVVEP